MLIFAPKPDKFTKLKDEYPELRDIPEFNGLNDTELLLVWYIKNRTSPYYKQTHKSKIDQVVPILYPNGIPEKEKSAMISGNFPEKIRIAMERMERFNPSARMMGKLMVDATFDHYFKIIKEATTSDDPEINSKMVSLFAKIRTEIPLIIKMKEEGFGVVVSKTDDAGGLRLMDKLMLNEDGK
jgi:hypothetical protein